MNPQECVWETRYHQITKTILQEKVKIHYSTTTWFTSLFLCLNVRDQVYITCCCEFLVRSGFLSLVWHMHSVCLLHGHVAHSSHSAEEFDSRFASEWENRSSAFVMKSSMIVHPVS